MKRYSTIIFDLFDTIVNFNFNHLPTIEMKGFRSRTTSIEVYDVFMQYYPSLLFSDFYKPFMDSYHEFQDLKRKEHREYPNRDRFKLMLGKMNLDPIDNICELEDKMVLAHMKSLASCVEFPEQNRSTLQYAKNKGYKMAMISNFDHAPTAQDLIDKFGIRPFFDEIVISEDVGWRKPKDIIFNHTLDKLDIDAGEALFVGDNFDADVRGSKAVGMDAVWINLKNAPVADLNPSPDFIITKLYNLKSLI